MERCVSFHRFVVRFCLTLCLAAGICGAAQAAVLPSVRSLSAQVVVPSVPAETQSSPSATSQQPKSAQYVLSHDRYEKAITYSRASYTMYFVSVGLNVLALVVFLRLGMAAKYRDWSESVSDRRWIQASVFVPMLVLTVDIVELPLRVYGHVLSLRYEMSVEGWGPWFLDWAKGELLMAGFALILALILSAVMHRSPRQWWLLFWAATLPIVLFVVFISPWIIDPLFNKFEPLQATNPDLVAAIENLTKHAGVPIPRDRMFLMRASEKTNEINAYVTGNRERRSAW